MLFSLVPLKITEFYVAFATMCTRRFVNVFGKFLMRIVLLTWDLTSLNDGVCDLCRLRLLTFLGVPT